MVRTRSARKRSSPNPPENEPPDIEEKKPRLDSKTTSKYFDKETKSVGEIVKDNGLELDENGSSNSNDSIICNPKRPLKIKHESDSDDSSSDEFLKVPFSLDDLGHFETLKKESNDSSEKTKDAKLTSALSRPSDSSSDEKDTKEQEYYDFSQIIQSQEFLINTKKEQEDRANQKKKITVSSGRKSKTTLKSTSKKQKLEQKYDIKSVSEELGISELLAMGEGSGLNTKRDQDSSESENDTEEVLNEKSYSVPTEGVQVTIELPNVRQKKKSKGFDMEAALKRRINLIRKENQILMHKVHTLCWIAHGIYLNRTINSDDLMGLALSLIPSNHCYPPKYADLRYLEKLVEWFIGKIIVNEDHKLAPNSSNLPLVDILESQIKMKVAFSLRDLVLMFICMVRSLGIHARLVISLRPVPLRPPVSDLCTVNNKPKEEKSANDSKLKKSITPSKVKETTKKPTKQGKSDVKRKENNNASVIDECESSKTETVSIKPSLKKGKAAARGKTTPKAIVKEQSSEIKSQYFSSADEVSVKELTSSNHPTQESLKSKTKMKLSNQEEALKNGKVTKTSTNQRTVSAKSKKSSSTHEEKNTLEGSHLPSPYFGSEKHPKSKPSALKKTEKNSVNINGGLEESTIKSKPRNRTSVSYREMAGSSSEDEVEIPKIVAKQKKTNQSSQKSICINPQLKNNINSSKGKVNRTDTLDNDFEPPKPSTSRKRIDRRVLSSDDEIGSPKKIGNDYWAEVYLESEEKWISVDLRKGRVHCLQQLNSGATQPVRYVLAWNNDGTVKDITRRYAPHWLTVTRRQRVDDKWWQETMAPYSPHTSHRERNEDEDMDRQMHDKPLPTTVGEYKNHPLFALRRHLLKFEAIYPPNAPTLGFVRGEAVYSRGCVVDLHTRETWIKEAKLVRRDEEPYKIVKARPKWDKMSQTVINDLPLPLFGHWQVEDYIPPPAVDGKVPRNEYGNVELYKPCMLPSGTVHLQVPQLARVARKLGIDCAPAVVGWEFSAGGSHPVIDGYIVCEEVQEVLLDAWNKEMDESAKRAKDKIEQRVYGNWKRLIKGLLIRERLKVRYDFGAPAPDKKKKKQPKPGTSKS